MANERLRYAMRMTESSNNYSSLGRVITRGAYAGDRAYGAYQVMGRNIPSWTEEALGRRMTPQQFLRDRAAQDAVFDYHFGRSLRATGSIEDAASIWHSGQPLARAQNRSDGDITTPDYVRRYMSYYERAATGTRPGIASPITDPAAGGQPSRQQQLADVAGPAPTSSPPNPVRTETQANMAPIAPVTGRDWSFVEVLDQLRLVAEQTGFAKSNPVNTEPRMARTAQVIRGSTM